MGERVLERRLACNSSVLLTQVALRHQGLALVPAFVAAELVESGALQRVLADVEWTDAYRRNTAYAITPAMRHLPATTRRLVDHLLKRSPGLAFTSR